MHRLSGRLCFGLLLAVVFTESAYAQTALTWQPVRDGFQAANPTLLQPHKERYLQQASSLRDTIVFSYNGAASLLDFLNAQADYRSVQVNYLNLIASYLNAANQLNLAVGREVTP